LIDRTIDRSNDRSIAIDRLIVVITCCLLLIQSALYSELFVGQLFYSVM